MLQMLLLLLVLVFICTIIHEAGHFLAALKCGVTVREFSVGMGPRLVSRQGKHCKYSLKLFPIGGSCDVDDVQMNALTPMKRMIIFCAGVTGNLILAILAAILMVICAPLAGFVIDFDVLASVVPGTFQTVLQTGKILVETAGTSNLEASAAVLNDMVASVPDIGEQLLNLGFIAFVLNISLFFFNLLPIPGLDGAYVAFCIAELCGAKASSTIVERVMRFGVYSLTAISVVVMAKDIILIFV